MLIHKVPYSFVQQLRTHIFMSVVVPFLLLLLHILFHLLLYLRSYTEILSTLSRNDCKCIPMNKKLTSSHLIFIYSFSRVNLWTKTETRPETPKSNRILFLQKNNSSISSQAIIRNDNVLKLYVNAVMCGYGSPISDKYFSFPCSKPPQAISFARRTRFPSGIFPTLCVVVIL